MENQSLSVPRGTEIIVPLCTYEQSYGILTHRELIRAWQIMLRETGATHVEVDTDELLYGLIDVTKTHYTQQDLHNPQMQALEDFGRTRWAWKRLKEKIKNKTKKMR